MTEYDELAAKHGWPQRGEDDYEARRDAYLRFQIQREQSQRRLAEYEADERASARWWYFLSGFWPLIALPAAVAALTALWVVPPLVWATVVHGTSARDVLRYVSYANEGDTDASGVFTPLHAGTYWALALFDVLFWLVVAAMIAGPLWVLGWWLERRDLRAVDEDLRRKGILPRG